MVHKEQYQRLADAVAMQRGCYALHIGKIGEETFVYSVRTVNSADFNPENQTLITVKAGGQMPPIVQVYEGETAQDLLTDTDLREFSTGRAIFKKYQTLVKNKSAIIGEGPGYAEAIVDAVASKAIKPSVLYQYLEIAEHYNKKLKINGSDIELVHSI